MNKAFLLLFVTMLCVACTKAPPVTPRSANAAGPAQTGPGVDSSKDAAPGPEPAPATELTYLPSPDRALTRGDPPADGVTWKPVGMSFPIPSSDVRYGLMLTDAPVLDQGHAATGATLPARSRVTLLETGEWEEGVDGFRSYDRVRYDSGNGAREGWVDSTSVGLIVADASGIAVGVVPARIFVAGGVSSYNLLVIADDRGMTLVDTSLFAFPGEFHPSGVLNVSIVDKNGDGLPEIVVEGETIVSFRFLGASPLRWVAWLRPRQGRWAPILFYNESFGSDEGYSYTAADRAFASTGSGMSDTVRVSTEYLLTSGTEEFRASLVSFYLWNGEVYRKAPLQDLPKDGEVTAEETPLLQDHDAGSAIVDMLHKGDALFVVDRADLRRPSAGAESWWYRAVTKSGSEGWITGADLTLSWVDPMKQNREVFLGQPAGP